MQAMLDCFGARRGPNRSDIESFQVKLMRPKGADTLDNMRLLPIWGARRAPKRMRIGGSYLDLGPTVTVNVTAVPHPSSGIGSGVRAG